MARTRSISSIDSEIQKIEAELIKVRNKQENLESTLLELQKQKQEIESKQVMDAFRKSGKSMRELMIFLEGLIAVPREGHIAVSVTFMQSSE